MLFEEIDKSTIILGEFNKLFLKIKHSKNIEELKNITKQQNSIDINRTLNLTTAKYILFKCP